MGQSACVARPLFMASCWCCLLAGNERVQGLCFGDGNGLSLLPHFLPSTLPRTEVFFCSWMIRMWEPWTIATSPHTSQTPGLRTTSTWERSVKYHQFQRYSGTRGLTRINSKSYLHKISTVREEDLFSCWVALWGLRCRPLEFLVYFSAECQNLNVLQFGFKAN